jgi:anaerobic magnesium-protoporphyrin IX monomethyl ester cyclase
MPDVLLGQAYHLRFDPKLWRAQQPFAPLGTLYAASYLRSRGRSVALYDAMIADSEREWADALDRTHPAVAVIYEDSFNYLTKMCLLRMREAALRMIDLARRRGYPVLVSGSDATDHPETYLQQGAVAVILGEAEVTLGELVDRLLSGQSLGEVSGIAYRDRSGATCRTAPRRFVKTLDDLPFPAWDLVDVARYRSIWHRRHGYHAMNVATTRGCPYHCNWCAKPIYGQRYAVRSPENVVKELAWLVREFQPDQISIVDDVFGLQPGWIAEFARLLADTGVHVPFRCLMRADQVTEPITHALASAGCRMVWMGAESGSQRILDAMEKGVRVEQIREANRILRQSGIAVGLFLQFGYPGETWDDIAATLALIRELNPDDLGVSVSYPLPGTRFYERVRESLGRKQNWVDSADLAMMYRATYEPNFYRVLHDVVHHEFRVRRFKPTIKGALTWAYNRAALPLAGRRLRRLAKRSAREPLPARLAPRLTRVAAGTPSEQDT